MDALRDTTETLIGYKYSMINAQAQSRRSRFSEMEMSENLKRSEALTEVVQLLESEDSIEEVMSDLLGTVGRFLHLSTAAVYRIAKQGNKLNIVSWWSRSDAPARSEGSFEIPNLSLFKAEKTLVLSENSVMGTEEREEMERLSVKALIILPIIINGAVNMYAYFGENEISRTWKIEEIRF